MPMSGLAFGVALIFPILTIALLDMYPHIRGTASSMQAFVSLMANAMISGLLVPWSARIQRSAISCLLVAMAYAFTSHALVFHLDGVHQQQFADIPDGMSNR